MQTKFIVGTAALAVLGVYSSGIEPAIAAPVNPPALAPSAGNTVITGFDIASDASGTRILLTGTQPFVPNVQTLNRPAATVITVAGRWAAGRAGFANIRKNGVLNVRYGQFADRPANLVRVVANNRATLSATVRPVSADHTRWEVTVWAPGVAPNSVVTVPVKSPAIAAVKTAMKPVAIAAIKEVTPVPAPPPAPVTLAAQKTAAPSQSELAAALRVHVPVAPMKPAVAPKSADNRDALRSLTPPPVARGLAGRTVAAPPTSTEPITSTAYVPATPTVTMQDEPAAGRRVSLDFVATDINDVLKALSLQSGINIVTGNDVKGNVTVSLKRVALTEALDMVTRLSGYTYARFGSAYVVGTPATVGTLTARSEQPAENITEFIPYRYNTSAVVYRALLDRFPGIKLPEVDKNEGAAQPRMLVLTENPKRAGEVREFIAKLEQAASVPTAGGVTEIYQIRYASPTDLQTILARLVPSVSVQPGPTQAFQPSTLGGSASFSASSSPAGGQAPGAGSPGSATPTTAGGAGTNTGGAGAQSGAGGVTGSLPPSQTPTTLLLTGTAPDIARARELLTQLDVRPSQIVYEAKVVDIANEDIKRFGLSYDFSRLVNIGETNTTGYNNVNVGPGTAQQQGRVPNFGAIFRTPYSIGVGLDAVLNDNKSRILASPNLSALDGQPAIVFIGDQIKYVISIQQATTGQSIQTETATVGITLKVTGKTSPDGNITLYVHPEVSAISSFLNVGTTGISLPQIATRFVDTTVRVKDGETIAIGGLIRDSDINNLQKVPFLGDLPFFGRLLFTRQNRTKQNSNVVVFITSRVLRD